MVFWYPRVMAEPIIITATLKLTATIAKRTMNREKVLCWCKAKCRAIKKGKFMGDVKKRKKQLDDAVNKKSKKVEG